MNTRMPGEGRAPAGVSSLLKAIDVHTEMAASHKLIADGLRREVAELIDHRCMECGSLFGSDAPHGCMTVDYRVVCAPCFARIVAN